MQILNRLLCGLAFAAAATTAPAAVAETCTEPALIVFDASGSMGARTTLITRLEAARRGVSSIVPEISAIRPLGLMVYSGGSRQCGDIRLVIPPAIGTGEAILAAIRAITPAGKTPLGQAAQVAVNYFLERNTTGRVVIVTDGEESCGADICAVARAIAARPERITIDVIGFAMLDREGSAIRCVAELTGGLYVPARSPEALGEALKELLTCPKVSWVE